MTADPHRLLERLYDEHAPAIYRWASGMLGSREEAEDAVQSIWMKLADRTDRLEELDEPAGYVWRTARHHVVSRLRRIRLERWWTPAIDPEREDRYPILRGEGVDPDERRDLLRGLRILRPRFRAVVVLVGLVGFTLEEAAERLGIPRGTAASRYHTAVRRLADELGGEEEPR